VRRDETKDKYEFALRQIETACNIEPDVGFHLNMQGIAQYRVGKYEDAAKTLAHSNEFNSRVECRPSDVTFLTRV